MISGNIINTLHRAVYRHSSCQFSLVPKIILTTAQSHASASHEGRVFSVPSCALHRTPLLLPQKEPCFHPQQDVVCSKLQMWLLMLQLG